MADSSYSHSLCRLDIHDNNDYLINNLQASNKSWSKVEESIQTVDKVWIQQLKRFRLNFQMSDVCDRWSILVSQRRTLDFSSHVTSGTRCLSPRDELFWQLMLHLCLGLEIKDHHLAWVTQAPKPEVEHGGAAIYCNLRVCTCFGFLSCHLTESDWWLPRDVFWRTIPAALKQGFSRWHACGCYQDLHCMLTDLMKAPPDSLLHLQATPHCESPGCHISCCVCTLLRRYSRQGAQSILFQVIR